MKKIFKGLPPDYSIDRFYYGPLGSYQRTKHEEEIEKQEAFEDFLQNFWAILRDRLHVKETGGANLGRITHYIYDWIIQCRILELEKGYDPTFDQVVIGLNYTVAQTQKMWEDVYKLFEFYRRDNKLRKNLALFQFFAGVWWFLGAVFAQHDTTIHVTMFLGVTVWLILEGITLKFTNYRPNILEQFFDGVAVLMFLVYLLIFIT